jgi:threonine aldolase
LPEKLVAALEAAGFGFYRWPWISPTDGVAIRLVTSFATLGANIDEFIGAAQRFA